MLLKFGTITNLLIPHSLILRLNSLWSYILIGCVLSSFICPPATALLRQHHESPNVLRYHAQESLKDRAGNTWQVLLFPDKSHSYTTYYLRLVGFPGVNSFRHPQAIEILTSQGKILTAIDAYAESAPAPNVGQYDLTPAIDLLVTQQNLKLSVPLENGRELALRIPSEVITEWQLLTKEIER